MEGKNVYHKGIMTSQIAYIAILVMVPKNELGSHEWSGLKSREGIRRKLGMKGYTSK